MDQSDVTITLPLTEHGLGVILTALGIGLGTGIVWLILSEQRRAPRNSPATLLGAFAVIMAPVWLVIFAGTLWQVWLMLSGAPSASGSGPSLGMGALLAALLGAPFLVWGTVLKQRTVDFQKEGHITDRINKAVEQLGAEKTISYVARNISRPSVPPDQWQEHNMNEYVDQLQKIDSKANSVDRHLSKEFEYSDWEVFTETVPNIEVRIGAILSLERIAQDSTNYDKGRDHVRVMEILCAYVRENAPASEASDFPFPQGNKEELLNKKKKIPHEAISNEFKLRADVQLALSVIGRRTPEQVKIEASHLMNDGTGYRLDLSHTNLRYVDLQYMNFSNASFFRSQMQVAFCKGADLSGANLRYAQLTAAGATKTNFSGAHFDLADLSHAELTDAVLLDCTVSYTHFVGTTLKGAKLRFLKNIKNTEVRRAFFIDSDLKGALIGGDLLGVFFSLRTPPDDTIPRDIYGVGFRDCRIAGTRRIFGNAHDQTAIPEAWLERTFGDASVSLAPGMNRPAKWPTWELPWVGKHAFETEWRKWQADPEGYTPPPKPEG